MHAYCCYKKQIFSLVETNGFHWSLGDSKISSQPEISSYSNEPKQNSDHHILSSFSNFSFPQVFSNFLRPF